MVFVFVLIGCVLLDIFLLAKRLLYLKWKYKGNRHEGRHFYQIQPKYKTRPGCTTKLRVLVNGQHGKHNAHYLFK